MLSASALPADVSWEERLQLDAQAGYNPAEQLRKAAGHLSMARRGDIG